MRQTLAFRCTTMVSSALLMAVLTGACATQSVRNRGNAPVPATVRTLFVELGGNNVAREMRDALVDEIGKDPRFTVVTHRDSADAVLQYAFSNASRAELSTSQTPSGFIQLLEQSSGRTVWQYTYRDQQTPGQMVPPNYLQQIRMVARQFAAELLRVSPTAQAAR